MKPRSIAALQEVTSLKRFILAHRRHLALLVLSFGLGAAVGWNYAGITTVHADDAKPVPAYLVASWNIVHPDEVRPFGEAAVPLARKAGLKMLAHAEPEVLEGSWPYPGVIIVQEYTSMEELKKFWRSADHAEAIKLREGHIDSHFVVAVEALPQRRP
jgi:uncharacterized protein (DUF1330 family)